MQRQARAHALVAVFCGLPGTGKTTIATELSRYAENDDGGAPTRTETAAPLHHSTPAAASASGVLEHAITFSAERWKASRKQLLQLVEQRLQQQQHQAAQKLNGDIMIIVDDTNHLTSMRYEFVQLARQYAAAFQQVYMHCSLTLAQQRNSRRQGSAVIPSAVIQRLSDAFEPPNADKNSWEGGHTLVVDCASNTVRVMHSDTTAAADNAASNATAPVGGTTAAARSLYQHLLSNWGRPLQPPPTEAELQARREAGSAANAASLMHRVDLESRGLLHSALAACSKHQRAAAASTLNAQRKQLLDQVKALASIPSAVGGVDSGAVAQLLTIFKQLCSEHVNRV